MKIQTRLLCLFDKLQFLYVHGIYCYIIKAMHFYSGVNYVVNYRLY